MLLLDYLAEALNLTFYTAISRLSSVVASQCAVSEWEIGGVNPSPGSSLYREEIERPSRQGKQRHRGSTLYYTLYDHRSYSGCHGDWRVIRYRTETRGNSSSIQCKGLHRCSLRGQSIAAMEGIRQRHPDSRGKLIYIRLDLEDLTTIRQTVDEFLQ